MQDCSYMLPGADVSWMANIHALDGRGGPAQCSTGSWNVFVKVGLSEVDGIRWPEGLPDHSNIASSTLQPPCQPPSSTPRERYKPQHGGDGEPAVHAAQTAMLQRCHSAWGRYRALSVQNAALLRRLYHAEAAHVGPATLLGTAAAAPAPVAQLKCPIDASDGALATAAPATRPTDEAAGSAQPRALSSFRCCARLAPQQLAKLERSARAGGAAAAGAPALPAQLQAQRFTEAARGFMARVAASAGCPGRDVCWFVESRRAVAASEHHAGGLAVGLSLGSPACMRSWVLLTFALQLESLMLETESEVHAAADAASACRAAAERGQPLQNCSGAAPAAIPTRSGPVASDVGPPSGGAVRSAQRGGVRRPRSTTSSALRAEQELCVNSHKVPRREMLRSVELSEPQAHAAHPVHAVRQRRPLAERQGCAAVAMCSDHSMSKEGRHKIRENPDEPNIHNPQHDLQHVALGAASSAACRGCGSSPDIRGADAEVAADGTCGMHAGHGVCMLHSVGEMGECSAVRGHAGPLRRAVHAAGVRQGSHACLSDVEAGTSGGSISSEGAGEEPGDEETCMSQEAESGRGGISGRGHGGGQPRVRIKAGETIAMDDAVACIVDSIILPFQHRIPLWQLLRPLRRILHTLHEHSEAPVNHDRTLAYGAAPVQGLDAAGGAAAAEVAAGMQRAARAQHTAQEVAEAASAALYAVVETLEDQAHGEVWRRSHDELREHNAEFQEHLSHWARTLALMDTSAKAMVSVLSVLPALPGSQHGAADGCTLLGPRAGSSGVGRCMHSMHMKLIQELDPTGDDQRRMLEHWARWRAVRCALDEELSAVMAPLAACGVPAHALATGPEAFVASTAAEAVCESSTARASASPQHIMEGLPGDAEDAPEVGALTWARAPVWTVRKRNCEARRVTGYMAAHSTACWDSAKGPCGCTDAAAAHMHEMEGLEPEVRKTPPGLLGQCAHAKAMAAEALRRMHGLQDRDAEALNAFRLECMRPGGVLSAPQQRRVLRQQLRECDTPVDTALLCCEAGRRRQHDLAFRGVRGLLL
eukprot:jgi/Ulvmu1/6819/UM031_0023.1